MAIHLLKTMKLCAFFLCAFSLIPSITYATSSSRSSGSSQSTLRVRDYLKRLNKPAFKSIKSPDGDIIDCVQIYNQPAFDHPSLRNHTIQMRPSVYPEGALESMESEKRSQKGFRQLWMLNGRCPQGTIPIRRIAKEDILRASSIERFGMKKPNTIPQISPTDFGDRQNGHEYAITYIDEGDKYYGAKANINVWNPPDQELGEFSAAQIWVLGGPLETGKLNSIESGWQVNPSLNGDNKTRLFIYWTSDGYQSSGCYNLLCPGFVQVTNDSVIGGQINPVSVFGGSQFDIPIYIWKDPKEGNWWLQVGNDTPLGYWPASLFTDLADSATAVEWGGEITNHQSGGQHTTTQMGSGHFPGEGFHKAAYFRNIKYVDNTNTFRDPRGLSTFLQPSPKCYDVQTNNGGEWEYYFFYGGPGRSTECP